MSGGASGGFWCDLVELFKRIWGEDGPKLDQDGPSWQQVVPKMGHDSAQMTVLGSVWEFLQWSWEHFRSPFSRSLEKV